jgi:hypothetical protein
MSLIEILFLVCVGVFLAFVWIALMRADTSGGG